MDYRYRNILKEPPDSEELAELASRAGIDVVDLVNRRSRAFKNAGVDPEGITSVQAGEIISQNPRIMSRPLFTDGRTLVVGFKPEEMEKLL